VCVCVNVPACSQIREGVRMMGMSDWALFSSWYITYIIMFTIGAVITSIVTCHTMFPNSSGILIFMFFFLFGLSSVAVCFFLR
jgi:ATP-binding cassette subfamily A (ABC1) protein 3